ncbi:uncharacterized protein LOC114355989 isoform X1 [Ostrinia furnacalis]|uniref:uncharacterized protein LOC114355989 isoform X1 n=1 Tax=Ostrinia furnacalis TaxID=93504 RepID=UPI001038D445|nr:uncharacterized protein LOC114355989 isoform X1 [Ostrinia furnacalis]
MHIDNFKHTWSDRMCFYHDHTSFVGSQSHLPRTKYISTVGRVLGKYSLQETINFSESFEQYGNGFLRSRIHSRLRRLLRGILHSQFCREPLWTNPGYLQLIHFNHIGVRVYNSRVCVFR